MSLRIISYLAIDPHHIGNNYHDKQYMYKKSLHVELKYFYMIKEFYSADGANILISILDKLNCYFEQPAIHAATLSTNQGVLLTHILLPTVKIYYQIISLVIQERNTEFKDLTAIEILLKSYSLMHYIPVRALCYKNSIEIKDEIIKILLAYTQPYLPVDGVDTRTIIHDSLWTLMIRELIKFILTAPHCFIPGLLVFTELLPLPLPLPANKPPSDEEMQFLIKVRQLWSAHLHPQGQALSEMIQTMCISGYRPLLVLLHRVCLQLSDLAPNMTLLVSKSIIDLILLESASNGIASTQLARLFGFLANLSSHPSVKVSMPALMNGKVLELMTVILSTADKSEAHMQAQENIDTLFQRFLLTYIVF
jgi:protein virilizer